VRFLGLAFGVGNAFFAIWVVAVNGWLCEFDSSRSASGALFSTSILAAPRTHPRRLITVNTIEVPQGVDWAAVVKNAMDKCVGGSAGRHMKRVLRCHHQPPPVKQQHHQRSAAFSSVQQRSAAFSSVQQRSAACPCLFFKPNLRTTKHPLDTRHPHNPQPPTPRHCQPPRRYQLEIAGGLGPTAGKVWRIGVMGYNAKPQNVALVIEAFKDGLKAQGKL